jgi:uncharacterized protein
MKLIALLALALAGNLGSQTVSIEEYEPKSTLVVPEHRPTRAKFPFIDVHNHPREFTPTALGSLLKDMDGLNMQIMVTSPVAGSWGQKTRDSIDGIKAFNKDRFARMTNVDYKGIDEPGYSQRVARQLEEDIKYGAIGLKVWKNFGLSEKDSKGKRIHVDDPRLDAVWEMCAKYKIPVLIHTADPWGLFQPMDKYNERWLELKMRTNRNHGTGDDPTWETLIEEQHNVFRRHKNTIFIDAHMGWMANNLPALGKLLDEMPNVYVEIGAITSELGRQPRFAHQWLIQYQDRVMFGKDLYSVPEYYVYFRLLETDDDYFDPIRKYHGIWKLYGLDLPDPVLKKLYYKNALKIFPGLSHAGFPD